MPKDGQRHVKKMASLGEIVEKVTVQLQFGAGGVGGGGGGVGGGGAVGGGTSGSLGEIVEKVPV